MSAKDFNKYAYFISRASNFAIVIRPDKKKKVDGEVVFEPGLRVEFNNKMLAVEKNKDNEKILEVLRRKIEEEKVFDPKKRTFFEEQPPKEMVDMEKVKDLLGEKLEEKNQEIANIKNEKDKKISELEKELEKLKKNK